MHHPSSLLFGCAGQLQRPFCEHVERGYGGVVVGGAVGLVGGPVGALVRLQGLWRLLGSVHVRCRCPKWERFGCKADTRTSEVVSDGITRM